MREPASSDGGCRADANIEAIFRSLTPSPRAAFITTSRTVSWAEWLGSVEHFARKYSSLRGARVALLVRPCEKTYALLVGLSLLACDLLLLDERATAEEIEEISLSHRFTRLIDPLGEADQLEPGPGGTHPIEAHLAQPRLTIFTSGSSGRPKPVLHGWGSLTRTVRKARSDFPQCWLLTYRPHLYAGLQVFLHCLLNQETLVIPQTGMGVEALLGLMRSASVRAVSATPSYWRRLVMMGSRDALKEIALEQITLGGELADQPLLDTLVRTFPAARVVHIYATSELGRCFSVKDGKAGFPADFLETASDLGVELKIVDGELHVRTGNAMLDSERSVVTGQVERSWRATGDQVERIGDRCYFVGRKSDLINVGGNKVQPVHVERVVQAVPGIREVRVFGRRSSLVGQMVACEFVTEQGFDPEEVKLAVQSACRERLAAHERPRVIQSVTAIELSIADKKIRQQ